MKTITMQRGDWSGESVNVTVSQDGSFSLMGYTFKLVEKTGLDPEFVRLCGQGFDIMSPSWQDSLGTVWVQDGQAEASSGDIERLAKTPIEAAVQILCNLI